MSVFISLVLSYGTSGRHLNQLSHELTLDARVHSMNVMLKPTGELPRAGNLPPFVQRD